MSEITPVTHTEKVVAGQVDAVTHFEKVIAKYGGGDVYEQLEAGTNILIEETADGKARISASGEVSSEDTVARAEIAAIKDGETLDSFGDVETALAGKADTTDIPTVPITAIQKNGTGITPVSGTVNITVPTSAADVSALPDTTKYAAALSLTINSSTYVMTGQLKDQNGDNLGTAQTIDLPLESVVVDGSYNSQTKKVVLTLQNGNTIEFSVADLVSGLQTELSASNKLNPAYIDYDSTHRAVSDTEKSTWNGKQSALTTEQLAAVNSGITSADVAQITTNKNNILSLMTPKKGSITWETGWTPTSENVSIRQYDNIIVGQIYCRFSTNLPTTPDTQIGTINIVGKPRINFRGIGYVSDQLYDTTTATANVFISESTGGLYVLSGTDNAKAIRFNFVYCTSDPS